MSLLSWINLFRANLPGHSCVAQGSGAPGQDGKSFDMSNVVKEFVDKARKGLLTIATSRFL